MPLLIAAVIVVVAALAYVIGRKASGGPATVPAPSALDTAAARQADQARSELAERDALAHVRAEDDVAALREDAERDVATLRARAQTDADELGRQARSAAEAEVRAQRTDIEAREQRLTQREERLAEREARLDAEQRRVEERDRELFEVEAGIGRQRAELIDLEEERRLTLERVAGLTSADAKAELVKAIENQAKREAVLIVRDIEADAKETGDERARKIVTLAIQRVASEQTAESVVSVLHLPSDDMKGRIIGREGRNIRAYESVTGVNLIIDDTPEAVLLSCFDPVRREVGRLTLEKLVLDGRIHPQRIEEMHERSKAEVEQIVIRAGEDALVEVGITDMHPELINLLGRLKYRTSYGQNVLRHLIEAAHIAGVMAAELKLPIALVKRCTLLHDLGKALTHEVEGSHALIGAEIARKYGEHEDVAHAIEAHHGEVELRTVEAVLTQAADAISGGRPGARRESLEHYVKRLERIEEIASSQPGVDKVFAMQAGREIRVMVQPDQIDDIQAQVVARDIAKQIEDELTYPGQIRVTVVRESRATEYAK
ncbi:MAG: ribonuclease Y [Mycobacteriales bacterium]